MPNMNLIERLMGGNTPAQGVNAIPSYVPTATSATVLTNQAGSAATLTVGTTQYPSGATTAPSFGVAYDGFAFKLRIAGKVTTGASCNITVAIMQGSTTTYTSGNVVATTAATAVNTSSNNFILEALCLWDVVSTKLNGYQTGQIANTLVSLAALTNSLALTSQTSLQFVPVITASATTGCTVTITEFVAETV
jgi:hypothetical protein